MAEQPNTAETVTLHRCETQSGEDAVNLAECGAAALHRVDTYGRTYWLCDEHFTMFEQQLRGAAANLLGGHLLVNITWDVHADWQCVWCHRVFEVAEQAAESPCDVSRSDGYPATD